MPSQTLNFEDENTQQGIELNFSEKEVFRPPLTDAQIDEKTVKYSLVLPEISPNEIRERVAALREDDIQYEVANKEAKLLRAENESMLRTEINSGQPDPFLVQKLTTPIQLQGPEAYRKALGEKLAAMTYSIASGPEDEDIPEGKELNEVLDGMDIIQDNVIRTEGYNQIAQDLANELQNQSTGAFLFDVAKTFVPLYNTYKIQSADRTPFPTSWLPGENKEEQRKYLLSLPPEQSIQVFKNTVEDLKKDNLLVAQEFVESILQANANVALFDNVMGFADAADILTLGGTAALKVGGKALSKIGTTSVKTGPLSVSKKVTSVLVDPTSKVEDVITAAGDTETAGVILSLKETSRFEDAMSVIPNWKNPELFTQGVSQDVIGYSNKLRDRLNSFTHNILDTTVFGNRAQRLPDDVMDSPELMQIAKEQVERLYALPDHAVMNMRLANLDEKVVNVSAADFVIGTKEGKAFETQNQAKWWADKGYKIDKSEYRIEGEGNNWKILVTKDIDESDPKINALIKTSKDAQSKQGIMHAVMDHVIGSQQFNSMQNRKNWGAIAHLSTKTNKVVNDEIKDTMKLINSDPASDASTVPAIMRHGANEVKPDGSPGKFYNLSELHDLYKIKFKRPPTEAEAELYYKYKTLSDADLLLRNLSDARDRIARGHREFQVPNSDWFEGTSIGELPWRSPNNFNVLVVDEKGGHVLKRRSEFDDNDPIRKALNAGEYRIVRLAEPKWKDAAGNRSLHKLTGNNDVIEFVATRNLKNRDLRPNRIPYNPGGHQIYKSPFFIKQLNIITESKGRKVLDDDLALFPVNSRAEGKELGANINKALELYRVFAANRKTQASKDAFKAIDELPIPWSAKQFVTLVRKGELNPDMPVSWAPSGKRLVDTDVDNGIRLEDYKDVYDVDTSDTYAGIDSRFTTERHSRLGKVEYKGSEAKPVLNYQGADVIDPMVAIDQGFTQIARDFKSRDATDAAVRNWLIKYQDVLELSADQMLKNPLKHFSNPPYVSNPDNKTLLSLAKANHRSVKNFMGDVNTITATMIEKVNETLADSIYKNRGSALAQTKAAKVVAEHQLPFVADPFVFFRSLAFTSFMGLFNPRSFIMQVQGVATVLALSPTSIRGLFKDPMDIASAAYAINAMRKFTAKDEIIKYAAKKNRKFLPNDDHFIEMYKGLEDTGWDVVGREVSNISDATQSRAVLGGLGNFVEKGNVFFRWGEEWTRRAAWALAYKRWRTDNPTATFTKSAQNRVMTMADDFALNMNRDSNEGWRRGLASTGAQFTTFPQRMLEIYSSDRLSRADRFKMFATHSVLYGLPTGTAGAFAIPYAIGALGLNSAGVTQSSGNINTDVREILRGYGINPNDSDFEFIWDGVINAMIEGVTGTETTAGPALGPGGHPFLEGIIEHGMDPGMILGPGGPEAWQLLGNTAPLLGVIFSPLSGDMASLPEALDALEKFGRTASTVNNATKAWVAFHRAKIISQNSGNPLIANVDKADAVLLGFGFSPQELDDKYDQLMFTKFSKEVEKDLINELTNMGNKAFQADSTEQRNRYLKEMDALLRTVPENRRYSLYGSVIRRIGQDDGFAKIQMNYLKQTGNPIESVIEGEK